VVVTVGTIITTVVLELVDDDTSDEVVGPGTVVVVLGRSVVAVVAGRRVVVVVGRVVVDVLATVVVVVGALDVVVSGSVVVESLGISSTSNPAEAQPTPDSHALIV
jgi:hypothetical protein